MEEELFVNDCMELFRVWVQNDMENRIRERIQYHHLERKHDNLLDLYPVVASILIDKAMNMIYGGGSRIAREMRKQTKDLLINRQNIK